MSSAFSTEDLLLLHLVQNFSQDIGSSPYNPPAIHQVQKTLSTVESKFCREILLPSYLLHIIQLKLLDRFSLIRLIYSFDIDTMSCIVWYCCLMRPIDNSSYEIFLRSNQDLYDKSHSSFVHKMHLIRRLFLNLTNSKEYKEKQLNNAFPPHYSEFVDLFTFGRVYISKFPLYLMHLLALSLPKPRYFRLVTSLLATFDKGFF